MLERSALDLDVIVEAEIVFEGAGRDALVKDLRAPPDADLSLPAGDGQLVLVRRDGDLVRREAGDR